MAQAESSSAAPQCNLEELQAALLYPPVPNLSAKLAQDQIFDLAWLGGADDWEMVTHSRIQPKCSC